MVMHADWGLWTDCMSTLGQPTYSQSLVSERACWENIPVPSQHTGRVLEWALCKECLPSEQELLTQAVWLQVAGFWKQLPAAVLTSDRSDFKVTRQENVLMHVGPGGSSLRWHIRTLLLFKTEKSHASWRKCWKLTWQKQFLVLHDIGWHERLTWGK